MSAWPRRLLRLAEFAGGAYLLYRGYGHFSHISEHQHSELLTHSTSRPRLAPTGLFRDRYFQNAQGLWIFKRMWRPTCRPVGTVFIVHGYGEVCGWPTGCAGVGCGWWVWLGGGAGVRGVGGCTSCGTAPPLYLAPT